MQGERAQHRDTGGDAHGGPPAAQAFEEHVDLHAHSPRVSERPVLCDAARTAQVPRASVARAPEKTCATPQVPARKTLRRRSVRAADAMRSDEVPGRDLAQRLDERVIADA